MNIPVGTASLLLLMFTVIPGVWGDPLWQDKLHGSLLKLSEMITLVSGRAYRSSLTVNAAKDLVDVLQGLVDQLKGSENLDKDVKIIQASDTQRIMTAYGSMKTKADRLFSSTDLKSHFALGSKLSRLEATNNLDSMCSNFQENSYEFTTRVICSNILECYEGNGACTGRKECDVTQAIPKMAVVLWYKVAAFLHNSLCNPVKKNVEEDFKRVEAMVSTIGAYVSITLEWDSIFSNIEKTGHVFWKLNVEHAMSRLRNYENVAKFSPVACTELKSEKMCPVGYIYLEYVLLKKLKQVRQFPLKTRNLRQQGRVHHGHLMELKKDALHQIKLLASIENMEHEIETHSSEFSKYFHTLQKYDEGIADQDIAFIKTKLTEFDGKYEELRKKFKDDFDLVKHVSTAANIAGQMENFFVNGFEALKGIGNAIITANEIRGLYKEARELNQDTTSLKQSFKRNADQISDMVTVVNDIRTGNIGGAGLEGLEFVDAYGKYTPQVDEDDLARNNELWSAYKDKACELLYEADGLTATAMQTSVGLTCEKLDGTLAAFFATRESIFDFQFDLVDALAKIIRTHIGRELSRAINIKSSSGRYSDLMLIFFKAQSRLQSEASLYCEKLEYLNHGKSIVACSSGNLFTETDIDSLIAYEPNTHYEIEERFVYLPTKRQFHGDEGYINLATLAEERKVSFRLPNNRTWLNEFNWFVSGEKLAPFVESFKIYLPLKDYAVVRDRTKHFKTRIQLTAKDGSYVDDTSKVKYIVPLENSQYVTVYEEGYDPAKCPRGKEIVNPYSAAGDDLPFICDTTTRVPKSRVMPTILSRWDLSFSVETGAEDLSWEVPDPATDVLIIAKVELRFPPGIRKRSRVYRRMG